MAQTPLSTLINRMTRYQEFKSNVEQSDLVRDLDEALRNIRQKYQFPWNLQKSSLRYFSGVYIYPVAPDHDSLAFLDDSHDPMVYEARPRFRYTSIQQFQENPDWRNQIAEIWDSGVKYLGINYNTQLTLNETNTAQLLNGAEVLSDWTAADDANSLANDTVNYIEGNQSIKFIITPSSGTATIFNTITEIADPNYMRKYQFKSIYLSGVPTSITLALMTDLGNFLSTTVTTQFSGEPFRAGQWNLIAQDLNNATQTGTFNPLSITSEAVSIVGAPAGQYNVDASYLRSWDLMDYWYYSKYNIVLSGQQTVGQQYFMDTLETYDIGSSLIGDEDFADVVMYNAMLRTLQDKKDMGSYQIVQTNLASSWQNILERYPSLNQLITTNTWNFQDDFNNLPYARRW